MMTMAVMQDSAFVSNCEDAALNDLLRTNQEWAVQYLHLKVPYYAISICINVDERVISL